MMRSAAGELAPSLGRLGSSKAVESLMWGACRDGSGLGPLPSLQPAHHTELTWNSRSVTICWTLLQH